MADPKLLETFVNPHPQRDYLIEHQVREFTSLCPVTGQPDFGIITIQYAPAGTCIELKSLKLYLQGFRNEGIFYEDVTNVILGVLATACAPKWMRIRTSWTVRGGIQSVITAQHGTRPTGVEF